jgi:hypothetical protein
MDVTIRVKDLGHFSVPKFTKHDLGYSGMHYIYNYIYIQYAHSVSVTCSSMLFCCFAGFDLTILDVLLQLELKMLMRLRGTPCFQS